jgi:hypothetical protein
MAEHSTLAFAFVANDPQGRALVIDVLIGESGRELWTEDGRPVTRVQRGRYRVLETGIELTSDDPEAV